MSKLTVTSKVILKGSDINEWAEKAYSSIVANKDLKGRECITFNSNNPSINITKPGYDKSYVLVYNSAGKKELSNFDSDDYHKPHVKKLGTISDKNIWLAAKGTCPTGTPYLYTTGNYQLEFTYNNGVVTGKRVNTATGEIITYDSLPVIMYVLLQGAGGGGSGATSEKNYYLVYANAVCHTGSGGGGGASIFARLDMSLLGNVTIRCGEGGAGGYGSDGIGGVGTDTQLFVNGVSYLTAGAGSGGTGYYGYILAPYLVGYDDVDSVSGSSAGSGGSPSIANSLPKGLSVLSKCSGKAAQSTSSTGLFTFSVKDKYTKSGTLKSYAANYAVSRRNGCGGSSVLSSGGYGTNSCNSSNNGASGYLGSGAAGGGDPGYDTGFGSWKTRGGKGGNGAIYIYY